MSLEELKRWLAMQAIYAFGDIERTAGTYNEAYHQTRFEVLNEILDKINGVEEQTNGA